ncbi:MAG: M1 family peptidase, partial [Candidatus Marinimicrobia bacterium]|nr:M1 family peptidase [Candidatus Neomarinimicrobiota bacterium]
ENFWKGIQSYYAKYQNLNATTDDFRREMEEASGMDLSVFFKQWLNGGGTLEYAGSWQYKNGTVKIILDQVQNDGYLFNMPLQIGIYKPGETTPVIETIQVNKKRNSFTIKVDTEPKKIVLDPNLWVLMEAAFEKKK